MPNKKYYQNNRRRLNLNYKIYYEKHKKALIGHKVEYNRNLRKKNKELVNYLKSVPCADCKLKYPPYVMDLDHVRGKKLVPISFMVSKPTSTKLLKLELKKCDVVCANCHRIRTFKRSVKREK